METPLEATSATCSLREFWSPHFWVQKKCCTPPETDFIGITRPQNKHQNTQKVREFVINNICENNLALEELLPHERGQVVTGVRGPNTGDLTI